MGDFTTLLQSGNAWLFVPSAILLGALHGLEPGHSKTMMAAFIVAVRGTVLQAVLLGLAATLSHTAIVWAIALAGLYFGAQWNTEATEPYLQLVSAALILSVAAWMIWRTWRETHHQHDHDHHHDHGAKEVQTGLGLVKLAIFEDGVPPRWRIEFSGPHEVDPKRVSVTTVRPSGDMQTFEFATFGDILESIDLVPEPHEFRAVVTLGAVDGNRTYNVEYMEHDHSEPSGLDLGNDDYADAHERKHAEDIKRRFANKNVTTGQIILFGLTGGLIPCPASITVLLLCLQLKKFALGVTLVFCFGIGLAITMVSVGAAAALSVQHLSSRWSGFNELAKRAPYFSSALIILVGLYTGYLGLHGLGVEPH